MNMCTIDRKAINPADHPAFRPHKHMEYEQLPERYLIPGCNNVFFQECSYKLEAVHSSIGSVTEYNPLRIQSEP